MNIEGEYPIGSGKKLYLNSKTNTGFEQLFASLKSFFGHQLSTLSFPGYSKEDIEQEMKMLAFEAIPRYNANRKANLITFLQNHVRNRLMNKCKYYSEKRRNANFIDLKKSKVRCNSCRATFKESTECDMISCPKCGESGERESGLWKFYNLTSVPHQMPILRSADGDYESDMEIDHDLAQFACVFGGDGHSVADMAIDIKNIIRDEPEINKSIIYLLCQGFNRTEVADQTGLSAQKVAKILQKIGAKAGEGVSLES